MTSDSLMLRRLVGEASELVGQRVQRVFPQGRGVVVVEAAGRLAAPQLWINGSGEGCGLLKTADCEPVQGHDTPLTDVLRRHLRGATLMGVQQREFDRVVELEFANCEGLGPQSRRRLIAEIMGRHSNLLLVDERDYILECARHVTARVNRIRQSLPGELYVPPPNFGKLDPSPPQPPAEAWPLIATPETTLAVWLRQHWQGASDQLTAAVAERTGLQPDSPLGTLGEGARGKVLQAIAELIAAAQGDGPVYVAGLPNKAPVAYPVPLPAPWQVLREAASLSEACRQLELEGAQSRLNRELQQRLQSGLGAARQKAARTETQRARALAAAAGAEQWRQWGEMLLAYQTQIPAGASEIELENWYTGQRETIPLDPQLSPQDMAQTLFQRYRKLQRVQQRVPPLLAAARRQREYLDDLLDQVEQAGSPDELRLLQAELEQADIIRSSKRRRAESRADYRRTEIAGYAVIYGRSGLENAAVLREARPDDLWFHVQAAPGGHVVVRSDNRPEQVPDKVLLEAARLAARLSRRRREKIVEVDYTRPKHLNRVKGGPPGYVIYREFRTLVVRPEG
jgi:predicted ribosome quality control (RQC) complex YloA/Tae2 family protein